MKRLVFAVFVTALLGLSQADTVMAGSAHANSRIGYWQDIGDLTGYTGFFTQSGVPGVEGYGDVTTDQYATAVTAAAGLGGSSSSGYSAINRAWLKNNTSQTIIITGNPPTTPNITISIYAYGDFESDGSANSSTSLDNLTASGATDPEEEFGDSYTDSETLTISFISLQPGQTASWLGGSNGQATFP